MRKLALILLLFCSACGQAINTETKVFQVRRGEHLSSVSRRLQEEGIIKDQMFFKLQATLENTSLKRGNYEIDPNLSYTQILKILNSGRSIPVAVTFPEGYTSFDIAKTLEDNNIVSSNEFITEITKPEYLQRYSIPKNSAQSLEGYLFPDTYHFDVGSSAATVVKAMLARFDQIIDQNILNQIKIQNSTLHKTLTMAAIIQKESGGNSEMALISGVYSKRTKIGMKIQADPTLIYALILDGDYQGNILTRHLRPPYPHPYNTYYIQGPPPGPIANPGKAAILAALNPKPTTYLYFVGKGDGTHQFSKTLVEHNAAVKKYQLKQS